MAREFFAYFEAIADGVESFREDVSLHPPAISSDTHKVAGRIAKKLKRKGEHEACFFFAGALFKRLPDNPFVLKLMVRAAIESERYELAEALCERHRTSSTTDHDWMLIRCALASRAGKIAESHRLSNEYAENFPAITIGTASTNAPYICVLTTKRKTISSYSEPFITRFRGSFPLQFVKRHHRSYRFVSLLVDSPTADRALENLPKPDLVWNHVTNGEQLDDPAVFQCVSSCADHWTSPCLNHPSAARRTARDMMAANLQGIEGLVVPRIKFLRYEPEIDLGVIISQVESEFDYPVIIRSPGFQEGINAFLCQNAHELMEAIVQTQRTFFCIQFVLNQAKSGYYRKMRAAFVGSNLHLLWVDYSSHWNARGRRSEPERSKFYSDNPEFIEEEKAAIADPTGYLGDEAITALKSIRERVELDYFGIDFDLMVDGKVLFFEANANMNFLNVVGAPFPHPQEGEERLLADFEDLLRNKISQTQQ